MAAPGSMVALIGRRLDIAEQERLIAMYDRIEKRAGQLTAREVEVRRMLTKLRYNRGYVADARTPRPRGTRNLSLPAIMEELVALEHLQRERALTHLESERLGYLVSAEQRRARTRPARIAKLRAELELLESLEIAQRGSRAIEAPDANPVDLVRGDDGLWSAQDREAA